MSLDRIYQRNAEINRKRQEFAKERAMARVNKIVESDQFKFYTQMPEASSVIDKIVSDTVDASINPVSELVDTLRAKGFKQAQIRKLVHNLYDLYIKKGDGESPDYDLMLEPVAQYVAMHQELYNTFTPDMLN
jgi:hypothetical protein